MHLQAPCFGPSPAPIEECLGIYLNLIKSNILPILLQQQRTDLTQAGYLSYNSLTAQNVGVYGRRLLDAICRYDAKRST